MALAYHFANLDTKEYFDPGIFGGNTKISGLLGDFLAGNALARLLVRDWLQSRIAAVNDDGPTADRYEEFLSFDKMKDEFTDISAKVFAMMCESQTEAIIQEVIENSHNTELSKNVLNYYHSSLATEDFKQKFTQKVGADLDKLVAETKKSNYAGLMFS